MGHHIWGGSRASMLALVCAALASVSLNAHAGVQQADAASGEVWQIFDSVADGLAQGYRPSTVDDFKRLLLDSNWVARPGSTSAYDFTGGAHTTVNGISLDNIPNIDFGQGLPAAEEFNYNGDYFATAAWLQGSNGTNALGIVERKIIGGSICSGGRNGYCEQFRQFSNSAEIASASDLVSKFVAGAFPSYMGADVQPGFGISYFDPLSGYRQLDSTMQAGVFMITSVPEPTHAALLGLGLVAVWGATRRTASRARGTS